VSFVSVIHIKHLKQMHYINYSTTGTHYIGLRTDKFNTAMTDTKFTSNNHFLRAFEKLWKVNIRFFMSVCLSPSVQYYDKWFIQLKTTRLHYYCILWHCSPARAMASSFTRFLDHKLRQATVSRTYLDEWSALRRDLYLTTHNTHTTDKHPCSQWDSNPRSQ
jgi:hypothetical protein